MNDDFTNTPKNGLQAIGLVENMSGVPMVSSLMIAERFGKKHSVVLRSIRNLECSEEFGRCNFVSSSYINEQGKEQPCCHVTEKGFSFLVMGFTGKESAMWKEKFLDAFEVMRSQIMADPSRALADPAQLRALLLENVEKVLMLETEKAELEPKAQAYEALTLADGTLCIMDAGKILDKSRKYVFPWLSSIKWIYRRAGNAHWVGYQDKIQKGYLFHKVKEVTLLDGTTKITEQVRITAKGLAKLAELIGATPA